MTFVIREPSVSDAAAIADLHVSTWREAYSHLLPGDFFSEEYIAARHRMWQHVLSNPREDVVVRIAESEGSLVGFAWVGPGRDLAGNDAPRDRHLYAIYLAASHYGSGAGQALLDRTLGDGPAMLWVAKENPRAVAFYVRNGFTFDGVENVDPAAPMITDAQMIR
jgi:ribosomal protein S18 acetylase RimI-like enzyme